MPQMKFNLEKAVNVLEFKMLLLHLPHQLFELMLCIAQPFTIGLHLNYIEIATQKAWDTVSQAEQPPHKRPALKLLAQALTPGYILRCLGSPLVRFFN